MLGFSTRSWIVGSSLENCGVNPSLIASISARLYTSRSFASIGGFSQEAAGPAAGSRLEDQVVPAEVD